MSLYSHDFQLLSKPTRSPLSWGKESTRAVLPNFENVEELNMFLYHLFTYEFGKEVFIQIKIGIALLVAILIVSSFINARRMYERNFWILRIIRVPSGPIIVPNPILSFGFIEANFVVIFLAFLCMSIEYYETHSLKPKNLILWILLPWCITIFGAIFAAVGTHYATPTRQIHIPNMRKEKISIKIGNLLNKAWVINSMAIVLPAFICITVAVPTFIGNYHFMKGQNQYNNDWIKKYSDQKQFSQQMIIEAQQIWFKVLFGTQIAASVYCLWFVWASVCFIIHSIFSFRILRLIKEELKSSDIIAPKFVVTTIKVASNNPNLKCLHNRGNATAAVSAESAQSRTYNPQGRRKGNNQNLQSYFGQSADESYLSPTPTQGTPYRLLQAHEGLKSEVEKELPECCIEEEIENKTRNKKVKFKSLLPNLIMTSEKHEKQVAESMTSSRIEQKLELRKAAKYILIQYLIIGPGCATFGGISLMMALTLHGSFEQPIKSGKGTMFQRFGAVALFSVTYVVIIFGCTCAIAVFYRTYEPVFVKYSMTATISSFGFNNQNDNLSFARQQNGSEDRGGERGEEESQTISYSKKMKKFILVGGKDLKDQNKLRYPQAMIENLIEKNKIKNQSKPKTVAEEISYQSSNLSFINIDSNERNNQSKQNKSFLLNPTSRIKPIFKPQHSRKSSGRGQAKQQYYDKDEDYYEGYDDLFNNNNNNVSQYEIEHNNETRRRKIEFLEAEPQEGQLVKNSFVYRYGNINNKN